METITTNLSWLCFIAIIVLIIPVIYYGARSRLRYARRIHEAQENGAFADMNASENKARIRRLAVFAFIGALGVIVFSVVLFLQVINHLNTFIHITAVAVAIFAVIASIAGFFIKREIDRRL